MMRENQALGRNVGIKFWKLFQSIIHSTITSAINLWSKLKASL